MTNDLKILEPQKGPDDLRSDYLNPETGLTTKDEHFLSILFSPHIGGNFDLALKESGLNESPFSVKTRLKTQIQEATKAFITGATPEAATSLMSVLRDPSAPGTKTQLTAIKEVLDRGGIVQREEPKATENYIFILPPKESEET